MIGGPDDNHDEVIISDALLRVPGPSSGYRSLPWLRSLRLPAAKKSTILAV